MATHFVPTEEIQKLTLDSYECLASKIDEAISRDAKKVFGESIPNKIERIGTFKDHVLLASDDGRFVKVKFESANNGSINIVATEVVTVPLYTDENIYLYLMQEAKEIVDSLLAHDAPQAQLRLHALLPFVDKTQPPSDEQRIESVIGTIRSDRPWKRVYKERQEQIRSFLGESLREIEIRKLPVKYAKMTEGAITSELVNTDIRFLSESIGGWLQLVEGVGDLKDIQTKVAGDERAVITTFRAFVEDLQYDLQSVREAALESMKSIHSAVCLGKLYDALAEESFHYEVATKFASMMGANLRESK